MGVFIRFMGSPNCKDLKNAMEEVNFWSTWFTPLIGFFCVNQVPQKLTFKNYSDVWQIMVSPGSFQAFLFRYPWIDFPLYCWPPQSVFIVSIVNGPVPSNDILENWMADGDPQNHLTFIYLDKTSSFDSQPLYCILIL